MSRQTPTHTISVPEAGRQYFGISRSTAYLAAHRGEIPTIRIGKLLRVPVVALHAMFEEACHSRKRQVPTASSILDDRPLEARNGRICGGDTETEIGPFAVSKCYDAKDK